MKTSLHVTDADFLFVVKAVSRGRIAESHALLLFFLSMFTPPALQREDVDYRVSVAMVAKSMRVHPSTVVKRLNFLSESGVLKLNPEKLRSNSRFLVSEVAFSRLPFIEAANQKPARDSSKTDQVKQTIRDIRSYLPDGPKRNFSEHPKFLPQVARVIDSGVNIRRYVRWLNRRYKWFSLGLFTSSYSLQQFRKVDGSERRKHVEHESRRENDEAESTFWRNR